VAFTFKSPLKVSHLAVSRLTLKGDVASATGTSHTFDTTSAAAVTSVGWTTGNAIIETYSGGGQAQTVQTVGKLKVEAAADRAAKAQLVAGSTGNATMSYKLTAYYEDVSVTQFYVGTTTGGSTNADVAKIKVYVNGTQVGATSGYTLDSNGRALVTLGPTELVVPKDSYVTLTLKVDLSDKTQLTDAANLEMGVGTGAAGTAVAWTGLDGAAGAAGTYYYFVATGKSSGAVLAKTTMNHNMNAATGYVYGSYIFKLYDGILTVSLSSTQPSTNATAGANKEVMRLDLTATGDDITVNDLEFLNGGTATITGTGVATLYSSDLGTTYTQWASGTAWLAGVDMHVAASGVRHAGGWDVPLVIAAGSTKQVRLFGDTSGAATTLTYQASVDNGTATASGVAWQNSSANAVDSALTKNLPVTGPTLVY
jgi:archaellum component FlaF (FlaF/FlaG flagellin family)